MAESKIPVGPFVRSSYAPCSCLRGNIRYYRYGEIVIVEYNGDSASSIAAGNLGKVGTIPEGFRPKNDVANVTSQECSELKLRLMFSVDGTITGYNYSSAISSIANARFPSLVYIAI